MKFILGVTPGKFCCYLHSKSTHRNIQKLQYFKVECGVSVYETVLVERSIEKMKVVLCQQIPA